MKISLRLLLMLLVPLTIACGSTDTPTDPPKPTPAEEAPKPTPAEEAPKPAPAAGYAGVYTNGQGGTLTISELVAGKGFEFQLTIKGGEECDGVDYKGSAKFSTPTKAASDDEDTFVLDKGKINFEPSVSMIGMDCMRVIDTDFTK